MYETPPPGVAVAPPSLLVRERSGGASTVSVKHTVTSLTAGVTVLSVVARLALYLIYRFPSNCGVSEALLEVKNVAAVPSGPTKLNGPEAELLPATWKRTEVLVGVVAVQESVVHAAVEPTAGLASLSAETKSPEATYPVLM